MTSLVIPAKAGILPSRKLSKYQTTIPKSVRLKLKLSVSDALEWRVVNGKAVVLPVQKKFLEHRNAIKTGQGDIAHDIELARSARVEKYR